MLQSIIYLIFDNKRGPIIKYETKLIDLDFINVFEYLIPKEPFCGKHVGFILHKYKIVGFPLIIKDASYERNSFIFNIAFVLDQFDDCSTWLDICKKTSTIFKECEIKSKILTQNTTINQYLDKIHESLINHGQISIMLLSNITLHLKIVPHFFNTPIDYNQTPILVKMCSYNHNTQKVFDLIDGVKTLNQIQIQSKLKSSELTPICAELINLKCIKFIDQFKVKNVKFSFLIDID